MVEKEIRAYLVGEFRAEVEGSRVLTGHAATFETLSRPMGGFREVLQKGAFADTIKNDDVRALFNHDPSKLLARNKSGTLEMKEDDSGLWFRMDVAKTSAGDDVLESVGRGDIDGMSFGFFIRSANDEEWSEGEDGMPIRSLSKVQLNDISPVTYPAYPDTEVAVRSLEDWRRSLDGVAEEIRRRERELAIAGAKLKI